LSSSFDSFQASDSSLLMHHRKWTDYFQEINGAELTFPPSRKRPMLKCSNNTRHGRDPQDQDGEM
jgi:hypothetical protein